ncbi:thermonuclease family protein [Actinomycetospora lutea]|uniref:thermonuclease family protein n=1 Tax=Actinomycetospora lutea TaxID=663604 RepID=UPI0023663AD1|nr:thermonuclease family protein [Actinomycetospora lutea]MDD7942905.1 thermonuclease family protein [Actinomycetospora lutea]
MTDIALGFRPNTRRVYDAPLLRGVDGDTVNIDQAVRMVSIDTPESHLGGAAPTAQATLDRCRQRLENGDYDAIDTALREHLVERLTPDAAAKHLGAGARAGQEFARMRAERLVIDPGTGVGKVGIIVTGEVIEENGRLLAYVTPWLKAPLPPPDDPRRRTFNLQLIETGWAAFFPIYPSLPRDADLNRAVRAAEDAWGRKLGVWDEFGEHVLLGYEYRACLKLGAADPPNGPAPTPAERITQAFRRVCIDVRDRTILGLYGYHQIAPPHRLWIWQDDLDKARAVLDLRDA